MQDVDVIFLSYHGNLPGGFNLRFNHEFEDCATFDIQANTTWSLTNPPPFRHFDLLTVKSGYELTIAAEAFVNFCENGKLVIEPNARLNLYGTLTTGCQETWKGVEVQGNGTANQFPNNITGVYAQGRLFCYSGSKIENAKRAVQLWGPDYEDAGGQIYAEGCEFLNNSQGLNFAPFKNYLFNATRPRSYLSSIRNCEFKIASTYLSPFRFTHHVYMEGIQGINLSGNKYINDLILNNVSLKNKYGFGIFAMDAGFDVGSTAANPSNEPCLPPCNPLNKSLFKGLGIGIYSGRIGENKPFQVWTSVFENCNVGIDVQGVDGFNIIFNEFELGNAKEWNGNKDQIGIYLSSYMRRIAIEENSLILDSEGADHTLGIVVDQIGPENNAIRRNTFEDIEIGNEAFGLNADEHDEEINGLHYLCNTNITVGEKDFYIPTDELYPFNRIRKYQCKFTSTITKATGNKFSTTGNQADGDFANYGDLLIDYFYYIGNSNETPQDYFGFQNLLPSNEPDCGPSYCLQPCISDSDFGGEVVLFLNATKEYDQAILDEEFELAAYYLLERDSSINSILNFIEVDTSNFNRDTLRKWYLRDKTIASDLILAGDYYNSGDYSNMNKTLDSIQSRFDLGFSQSFDIGRVKYAYSILTSRSIHNLTNTDIDSLRLFSESIGASSNLARNILALVDTFYMPRYFVPGELNPRSAHLDVKNLENIHTSLYPNPSDGTININYLGTEPAEIWIFSTKGELIDKLKIYNGKNTITLRDNLSAGLYFYTIHHLEQPIVKGRFVLIK